MTDSRLIPEYRKTLFLHFKYWKYFNNLGVNIKIENCFITFIYQVQNKKKPPEKM